MCASLHGRRLAGALAVASALLLVAASAAPAYTVTLRGPKVFTTVVLDHDTQTAPYDCSFTRGLHHPDRPGRGQVVVGFDNFYDPGTEPFPCWEKIDHAYRGYVRFDVGRFFEEAPDRADFTSAELRFRLRSGRRVKGTVAFERAFWSSARRLGLVTSRWSSMGEDGRHVQRGAFHSTALYDRLPIGKDLVRTQGNVRINRTAFRIDVSDLLEELVCGERPNHGFVLTGPEEDYRRNNDEFVSVYEGFQLVVAGIGTRRPRRC